MMGQQQALQYAKGLMDAGMSAADANVELVRMQGISVMAGKLTRDLRSALMAAVKDGRIGHLKKDGLKPEVFFHPNSEDNARSARNKAACQAIEAIKATCI